MRTKQRNYILTLIIMLFVLLISTSSTAWAQSYSFAVPMLKMQVIVQPDGSTHIVYDITFENYGQTIDIVDIGTPHSGYDIGNMRASIGGVALSGIYVSEYVNPGVEIHLGQQAIPNGGRGTLHFEFTMPDMVYEDTTNRDNASLQITPTWFDRELVRGTSDIQLAITMLEGIKPEEVVYQDVPFDAKIVDEETGLTVVGWRWPDASATQAYRVGVSFPKRGMSNVIKLSLLDLVRKFMRDHPGLRFVLGLIAVGLFTALFFRFSGGTGFSVFVILTGGLVLLLVISPILQLLALPALILLVYFNERSLKTKRKTYLPPIAQVEGGGIKRGLTAPEAATLLEMPLNKILTLVIFGLLEKGIVEQTQDTPLMVSVADDFQTRGQDDLDSIKDRRKFRRRAAQRNGTVVHTYEDRFLDLLEAHEGKPVQEIDFSGPVKWLIRITAAKMKGFDLSDTQDYYRRVIDRAMKQAESLGEIEQREKYLDKYLPWVMMNDNYPTVFRRPGYSYWPVWVRRSRAVPRTSFGLPRAAGGKVSGRSMPGGRTSASDVAASFAGWAENTMGGMAAAILPSSLQLPSANKGIVNLSGVDRVTGDIFEALASASKSSGGGGGGGGCACACAGCACACACAGGGR